MCRFSSPVDFIVSYNATLTSTLHGSDKLKVQKKPEVQKDDLTQILLISRRKQRNLKDCLEKQLFIEHIVKQLEKESIENVFQ